MAKRTAVRRRTRPAVAAPAPPETLNKKTSDRPGYIATPDPPTEAATYQRNGDFPSPLSPSVGAALGSPFPAGVTDMQGIAGMSTGNGSCEAAPTRPRGMVHDLKIWPVHYRNVEWEGKKFDVRRDDRDYRVGDLVLLREFMPGGINRQPGVISGSGYTGSSTVRRITFILRPDPTIATAGLYPGYCVLGFGPAN